VDKHEQTTSCEGGYRKNQEWQGHLSRHYHATAIATAIAIAIAIAIATAIATAIAVGQKMNEPRWTRLDWWALVFGVLALVVGLLR
jgi:uncharacterized membrane protein HdeD (DUF308 family)